MMLTKKRVWVVLCVPLLLALNVNSANNESKGFLLTGPKQILRGTDERFCLHLQRVQSAGQVTLELLDSRNKTVGSTVQQRIDPKKDDYDGCIPLVLSVSSNSENGTLQLKLKVKWDDADTDLIIDTTKAIHVSSFKPEIQLIQTDKVWYTPGQLVRFRTLTLSHLLQPIITPIRRVWCADPSGDVVVQWYNVTSELGLAQFELQLSVDPVQGTWKIFVDHGTPREEIKKFEVRENVLPRFEVTIVGPESVSNTAERLNFSVCGNYTFGEPIQGQVDVEVKLQRSHFWYNPIGRENDTIVDPVKLNGTIDKESGCYHVIFPLSRLGKAPDKYSVYRRIEIVGVVTEKEHGVKRNATHRVQWQLESPKVVLELYHQHSPTTYELGLPYIGKGKLFEESIKKPVANAKVLVCVKEGYKETNKSSRENIRFLDEKACVNVTTNGMGDFSFSFVPKNSKAVGLAVEGRYLHSNKAFPSVYLTYLEPSYSPSSSFAVIPFIPSQPLACNSVLPLKVYFSKVEKGTKVKLHYFITGRGDILAHGIKEEVDFATVDVDLPGVLDGTSSPYQVSAMDLEIKVIPSFYPKASIMVYYVREDGEVVTAQAEFTVSSCFPNPVTLQWNAKTKYPGATAELNLHSTPGSLCGLSVVDQSVLLVKPEDQLAEKTVQEELKGLTILFSEHLHQETSDNEYCRPNTTAKPTTEATTKETTSEFETVQYWRHVSFHQDAIEAFDAAGLLVMSNWGMQSRPCHSLYKDLEGRSLYYGSDEDEEEPVALPDPLQGDTSDVRAYIPDTWLWNLYTTDSNGNAKIEQELPRRITSWVGRALCVSSTAGFGISAEAKIEAFQPLFLVLGQLPYSIKRGEKLTLKVSANNYLDSALPVKVTINLGEDVDIISASSDDFDPRDDFDIISATNTKSCCVDARNLNGVEFIIRPTRLGRLNITIQGQVDHAYDQPCGTGEFPSVKDAIVKSLLVESPGFPVETTLTQLVCPGDFTKDQKLTWNLTLPTDLVNGSARGSISVVGDLMGPALDGLTDLVRLPTGSGEPNMVTFTPVIFVIEYLEASKQLDDKFKKKAIGYLQSGYERELKYRNEDGSYSAFNSRDRTESVWLTAFVVKSFAAARKFISINSHDIDQSVYWILSNQLKNGCFRSPGKLLHKGIDGGWAASGGNKLEGLTAFTMISLLESKLKINDSVIENATKCIKNLRKMNQYTQALITYALVLSKDKEAGWYVDRLLKRAQRKNSNMWWERKGTGSSINVETTSYALLALLKYQMKPDMAKASNIVRWLTQQRNAQGGFLSTQDTVMGLQALAAYATAVGVTNTNMTIKIAADKLKASIAVQEKDKLVQKQVLLPVLPTKLEVETEGKGCAVLQATVRYNVHTSPQKEAFDLTLTPEPIREKSACVARELRICAKYLLPDSSNMAIVELDLVSGYVFDKEWLEDLTFLNGNVERVEEKDNKIVLYIDSIIEWGECCVGVAVLPAFEVNDALPANVKISDYYEQEKFFIMNYTLPTGCAL